MDQKKIMVIAAHIGDFVWRCGGTIAKYTKAGATVHLVVLSYGMRGESNAYWKQPDATLEDGKQKRHDEGMKAAKVLGVSDVTVLDYDDYPIELTQQRMEDIAVLVRKFNPDLIFTHDSRMDPYNQDHTSLGTAVYEITSMAAAKGAELQGYPSVPRALVYGFEPHVSEASSFSPDIYVDITESQPTKEEAMKMYETQKNMLLNYINRAKVRAQQSGCGQYSEAFSLRRPIFSKDLLIHD